MLHCSLIQVDLHNYYQQSRLFFSKGMSPGLYLHLSPSEIFSEISSLGNLVLFPQVFHVSIVLQRLCKACKAAVFLGKQKLLRSFGISGSNLSFSCSLQMDKPCSWLLSSALCDGFFISVTTLRPAGPIDHVRCMLPCCKL